MLVFAVGLGLAACAGRGTAPEPTRQPVAGWAAVADMGTTRSDHSAALLPDGRVLVAGGSEEDGTSAEIYDPQTDRWSPTGAMLAPRVEHTTALLRDGRVLVLGGSSPDAEVFDPVSGTWAPAGQPGARYGASATVLLDGRVLVAGGLDRGTGESLATTTLFDPTTGTWTMGRAMRGARFDHAAVLLLDWRVLVAEGFPAAVATSRSAATMPPSAELFDPATGAWADADDVGAAPASPTGVRTAAGSRTGTLLPDGGVLVMGGMDYGANGQAVENVRRFDPATSTWTTDGRISTWVGPVSFLLPDGRVLIVSSLGGNLEVYDPAIKTARGVPSGHEATSGQAVTLLADGRLLMTGGVALHGNGLGVESERLATAHVFDASGTPSAPATPAPPTPVSIPVAPPSTAAASPVPTGPGVLVGRVAPFSEGVRSATDAIPREAPEARRANESFDAYAERARAAAKAGAGGLRDLVDREKTALAGIAVPACPFADRYRVLVSAYSVVVNAVWAALYAPDADLLQQGLVDLDALNTSLAAATTALGSAPDACAVPLETGGAALASRVVGTQSVDIARSPDRTHESTLGDLVADAMRARYPDADAALLNSGNLRTDLLVDPPSAGERSGEITWGEMVAVLPFGDRAVIVTVSGDQLAAALANGFAPACDPTFKGGTGRLPQLSGLTVRFHCEGGAPVVDGVSETPEDANGPNVAIGPTDSIRLVTVDYLLAGGDGYSMLAAGRDLQQPGDALLDIVMDYLKAVSPVAPALEGRIVGP